MDVHESRKRQSPFLKLKLFPLKKGKKKRFQVYLLQCISRYFILQAPYIKNK